MANQKILEKKIRRYQAMNIHREMVRNGQLVAARIMLELLKNGRVHLGLDDDSYAVEIACEKLGCHIYYDRRGYSAVVHL